MVDSETKRTERPVQDIGRLTTLKDDEWMYMGRLYDAVGPASGASVLAWNLAQPGYETIETAPSTDVLVSFSNGDYARIRLDNPEDVKGKTHEERRENNENDLKWSLTNVGMQSDPSGPVAIGLTLDTILSTRLRIGEPLTLTPAQGQAIRSKGVIEQIFVYKRNEPLSPENTVTGKLETELLRNFRTAVAIAKSAIKGTAGQLGNK